MADDLSVRYGSLLTGWYDCVDRIVLNAFFPSGCSPGGFRTWCRALHDGSDEHLDDTRLMRMAGRFARRVRARAEANDVPVIYCETGERKHLIAGQHLAARQPGTGVFTTTAFPPHYHNNLSITILEAAILRDVRVAGRPQSPTRRLDHGEQSPIP